MGGSIQTMSAPDIQAELSKTKTPEKLEDNPLLHMLPRTITIENFPCPDIIEVYPDNTVREVLKTLLDKKILSVPVWDEEKNDYLGFLHVVDLLTLDWGFYLLDTTIQGPIHISPKVPEHETLAKSATVSELFKNEEFAIRARARYRPVPSDASLVDVMRILNSGTLKRVPVLDCNTGRIIKIISQSTIVEELNKELHATKDPLPSAYELTARQTGIGIQDVVAVDEDVSILRAFTLMVNKGVSAVAVLDDEKKLETMVSLKDLRLLPVIKSGTLLRGPDVPLMDHNAREYAAMVRQLETNGKSHCAVATVTYTTPFNKVIAKLAETKMHRVFIVDDYHKPIGVISISDIFHLLCYNVLPGHLSSNNITFDNATNTPAEGKPTGEVVEAQNVETEKLDEQEEDKKE